MSIDRLDAADGPMRVLLTGASGVVGHALVPRLRHVDLTCLVHATPVQRPHVRSVRGDLTRPNLGLDPADYAALARSVDVVVHGAAVTEFNRDDGSLEATNVDGTRQIVAFAEEAGARFVHVSTAYLHATADGDRSRTAVRYAASKRAGEDIVRASAAPHVIVRPSIVIGDSVTGFVKSFQGMFLVAGAILDGFVPVAPFDPTWLLDFVPSDVVADAIATAVDHDLSGEELWITAGERALDLGTAFDVAAGVGEDLGLTLQRPRFVPPDVFDRLFAPVFLDALPRRVRFTVLKLLEFFGAYLAVDEPLPSDLARFADLGAMNLPDQEASLRTSLHHWAATTGRAAAAEAGVA